MHRATAQRLRNSKLSAAAYRAFCAALGANSALHSLELSSGRKTLASTEKKPKTRDRHAEASGIRSAVPGLIRGQHRGPHKSQPRERRRGRRGRRARVAGSVVGIAARAPPRDAKACDQGAPTVWEMTNKAPPTLSKAARRRPRPRNIYARLSFRAANAAHARATRPLTRAHRRP